MKNDNTSAFTMVFSLLPRNRWNDPIIPIRFTNIEILLRNRIFQIIQAYFSLEAFHWEHNPHSLVRQSFMCLWFMFSRMRKAKLQLHRTMLLSAAGLWPLSRWSSIRFMRTNNTFATMSATCSTLNSAHMWIVWSARGAMQAGKLQLHIHRYRCIKNRNLAVVYYS